MNIGELARRSGVNAKAIRYYESIDLLPEPPRTESGYRQYSGDDVERLRLIGRARRLGFSIEECRRLIRLWNESDGNPSDMRLVVMKQVAEIDRKIRELNSMRMTLVSLAEAAEDDHEEGAELLQDERFAGAQTRQQETATGRPPDGGGPDSRGPGPGATPDGREKRWA